MTLAIVLATCTMTMAQAQGRLKGKITDDTGETVPFANVIVDMTSTRFLRERMTSRRAVLATMPSL